MGIFVALILLAVLALILGLVGIAKWLIIAAIVLAVVGLVFLFVDRRRAVP